MAKNNDTDNIMEGKVVKSLPDARFEVLLDNGHLLKEVYISGRMRQRYIHIARGDTVKVAMTPYDLSKGRIIFRKKKDTPSESS